MAELPREVSVRITAGSVITVLLFVILAALLWYLQEIVLILLTAVVIASAMEPGVLSFTRRGVPRVLAVILMYLIIATIFFGVLFFFVPPIVDDAANFIARLPDTLRSLNLSASPFTSALPIGDLASLLSSADFLRGISSTLSGSGGVIATLSAFFGGVVSFFLVVLFSFYFSVQETGVDDFLRVVTPVRYQAYVQNLWKRSQDKIGKWMQGQLLLALIVGVMLYLLLTIFGIPYALLLSVLAALFELIPVFGQILAAIPAIAVATVHLGIGEGVLVTLIYVIVQQFEAHLIYPLVVKKVVGVPPLLVILALLIGGKLAGFIGVLLAVPLAAVAQELVADLESRRAHALIEKSDTV